MADMKTLNVRIKNKYDSYENWAASGLVLEAGELAIAYTTVDVAVGNGTVSPKPQLLLKVGNGSDTFAALPWLSAKAADVASWAKAANKPTYSASEITGISEYIAEYVEDTMGITVDTDTLTRCVKVDDYNYKLQSKGKNDSDDAWTDIADSVIVIPNDTAAIEALEALVGEKSVATQISEAIAALDLANTYEAKGEAAKVQSALNEYKTANDAAVEANADAISAEAETARAAEKANADAIDAVESDLADEIERAKAAEEANATAAAGALAEAQKKVASVAAGDASVVVGGTSTAPTVATQISQDADNALSLAADGLKVIVPAAAEYTIVKAADSGDYAAVYNLTKDGAIVGASINIPKDMVVKSGSVVDGDIVLVLNDEANTEIVIPADSLIEYVTSGSATGDMVVISVSDDHKVTATITDGSITLAKLSTEIQTAIGKAHAHANAAVLDGISADDVAAWDASEQNAKTYADGLNTAMNTRMEAVEGKAHEHSNKTVLDGITEAKVSAWDAAEQNAKDFATGLNTSMDTRVKAIEDDYLKSADKTELEGKITAEAERAAAAEAKALTDAKAYTDEQVAAAKTEASNDATSKANQALADAKAYTDELDGELAAIAKTGNVNDLIQTAGTYIIFDCGTSAI